jgi:predicted phosphodiesterase
VTLRVVHASTYARGSADGGACPGCHEPVPRYVRACPDCGFPLNEPENEALGDLEAPLPPGAFRLAHLSDLHLAPTPRGLERLAVFERWLAALGRCRLDGLVISGDLSEVPDLERFRTAWVLLRDSGLRWAVVPGNHDVEVPGNPGAFTTVFGGYPRVERWGPLELLLLDSNAGLAVADRGTLEGGMGWLKCFTEGRVGAEQLAELERQLGKKEERTRVLVLHHHLSPQHAERLAPLVDDTVLGTMGVVKDADAVRCWAVEHQVTMVLHGHKHVMLRTGMLGGEIVILNGGSSTQAPRPRARLVDFLAGGRRRVVEIELAVD